MANQLLRVVLVYANGLHDGVGQDEGLRITLLEAPSDCDSRRTQHALTKGQTFYFGMLCREQVQAIGNLSSCENTLTSNNENQSFSSPQIRPSTWNVICRCAIDFCGFNLCNCKKRHDRDRLEWCCACINQAKKIPRSKRNFVVACFFTTL